MEKEHAELICSGDKLYILGIEVENARTDLRRLVKRGIPYNSPEMLTALERFERANAEWKRLESEHLDIISYNTRKNEDAM